MNQLVAMAAGFPAASGSATDAEQYLSFAIGAETCAVHILHVKEIIEYGVFTKLNAMPDFVRGVINLRGAVVPVVDLAARMGSAARPTDVRGCVVIMEIRDGVFGLDVGVVVDSILEVLEIRASDIEAPPSIGGRVRVDCVAGTGRHGGRRVILLDVDRVLDAGAIVTLTDRAIAGGAVSAAIS